MKIDKDVAMKTISIIAIVASIIADDNVQKAIKDAASAIIDKVNK